ncbi:MAG: succinate dehydrogenase cytochrome b subunit [Saprospiraceae bacterium]|nr:succinate dehydrogenase cytochrome b subunit [Saprospiraceae bacterium]
MSWFSHFLKSSIGQKLIMSLTGLFLILFLVVHLIGNLQLLAEDGGESFNVYARFMTSNPLIKTISYGLYFFILLHTWQGIVLWFKNRAARGKEGYAVKKTRAVGTSAVLSSRMAWLGIIVFVFIVIHMVQFWLQMKLGNVQMATYPGHDGEYKDLFVMVIDAFKNPAFVIFYVICMYVIGLHLWHGFQSSFQTLGLNHKKYTPLIKGIGKVYSILIPAGFAIIPIIVYLFR